MIFTKRDLFIIAYIFAQPGLTINLSFSFQQYITFIFMGIIVGYFSNSCYLTFNNTRRNNLTGTLKSVKAVVTRIAKKDLRGYRNKSCMINYDKS